MLRGEAARTSEVLLVCISATVALGGAHAKVPASSARAATSPRPAVVAYLVSASGDSLSTVPWESSPSSHLAPHAWQWRVFDPASGRDTLVFTLPSFPTRIRWDLAFDSVEFVISKRIMRADWRVGAVPREQARLPMDSALCSFWRDAANHRWHVITQREVRTPIEGGREQILQIATRWDLEGSGNWRAAEVDSGGDANGGCFDSGRLHRGLPPDPVVTMNSLLDSMRIGHHRSSTVRESPGNGGTPDRLVYVPSADDSSVGVEVNVAFGDSEHAMEPIVWVDRAGRTRRTVYAHVDSRDDALGQIALAERRGCLLIALEYSGAFPALVDLRSGKVLFREDRPSARAVWVPAPR